MIFLVTEDQQFLEAMTRRLRERGKSAMGISETQELRMHLRQRSPDILILDGNSPHIDVMEILKDLQNEGYQGQTIVLGGESSAPLVPEISRFGVIQTAGRPLAVNRVLGAIRIAHEHLQADRCPTSVNREEGMKSSTHQTHFS
ncbi:MAG: response regulator [Nitrospira sp.]|nr:response regulator [Nitrospira sp.]HBP89615.1 hypothetical protein [Nitrospiraceae bacterium]HNP27817.1 response regulator [Nitrospirales bacterium]